MLHRRLAAHALLLGIERVDNAGVNIVQVLFVRSVVVIAALKRGILFGYTVVPEYVALHTQKQRPAGIGRKPTRFQPRFQQMKPDKQAYHLLLGQ